MVIWLIYIDIRNVARQARRTYFEHIEVVQLDNPKQRLSRLCHVTVEPSSANQLDQVHCPIVVRQGRNVTAVTLVYETTTYLRRV